MLLVFGGYTATGATRKCFAWGCEPPASSTRAGGYNAPSTSSAVEVVVVYACPASANTLKHAKAAAGAFTEKFDGAQVIPTTENADVADADGHEQALSMLQQRLQQLQVNQRSRLGSPLLARARMVAAIQPCVVRMAAQRTFMCFWIGVVDTATGRQETGASFTREIQGSQQAWASRSLTDPNEESIADIAAAWRSLLRGF